MKPCPERDRPAGPTTTRRRSARERGQVLVIFAFAIVFFIGLMAIVVDISWYWANSLKVQRAADAAALAGAVWLPDQPVKARTVALAAAKQDGYVPGGLTTVTADPNPSRDVQLDTRVSAPVSTFFMRLFGISSIQATRTAKAEYVLPVPMGSPLNYFGAFGALRGGWIQTDSGWLYPTATRVASGVPDTWSTPQNAYLDESPDPALNTTTANVTDVQGFTRFRSEGNPTIANFGIAAGARFQVGGGIEVVVQASTSDTSGLCQLQAEVSSNADLGASATWYGIGAATGNPATLTATPTEYEFGGDASTAANDRTDWWRTTGWTVANFTDAHFAVRIKALGAGSCTTATTSVDYIRVRVNYEETEPAIKGPNNESLVPKQGVWAGILSQGADVGNGDAYATQVNGSGSNTQYAPTAYYDYAVEMQPGSLNGSVYVFDPVFCATQSDFTAGMGDHWYDNSADAMSTFYDLYDTNNTPYDLTDDTWIAGNTGPAGAGNPLYGLFRKSKGSDPGLSGPSYSGWTNCQRGTTNDKTKGAYWHNRWWRLATGIAGPPVGDMTPRVYRIRVTSTDPAAPNDQSSVNALNNFSLFASVKGHACPTTPLDPKCPRVYGLGVMEAFAPLDPSKTADLYLSQIGPAYAGKTIKVSLWDPGDTNGLTATLSFLMPTSSGYTAASFTYTATKFAVNGVNCNGTGSGTSLVTSTGTSKFNGCWVVFSIPIPTTYTAPKPSGEPGPGWWKIRYVMGSGSASASDLTTWKTQILGNPVHLVVP